MFSACNDCSLECKKEVARRQHQCGKQGTDHKEYWKSLRGFWSLSLEQQGVPEVFPGDYYYDKND